MSATMGNTYLTSMSRVETSDRGEKRVNLDLRSVEQADSVLMAAIVLMARRCKDQGLRLYVQCSTSVKAWVELCRLDGMVEVAGA